MSLSKDSRANFDQVLKAAKIGQLALVECQESKTGAIVPVICALNFKGKQCQIVPFARLFEGNPYEQLNPPDPNGGFLTEEKEKEKERV